MARDDDGDGIGAVGQPDGPRRRRLLQLCGQRAVMRRPPRRDPPQRRPDPVLEFGAAGGASQIGKGGKVAGEIAQQGSGRRSSNRCCGQGCHIQAVISAQQTPHAFSVVFPVHGG
jgi:hypothetical protein